MKIRNLFLAGLAAFAMASCSNNEELIDNGNQGEKTSLMQFGIEFPKSAATRAESETEAGTVEEYDFSKVAIVIFAQNGNKSVMTFGKEDFTSSSKDKHQLFLKNSISVEAGATKLYAFVNPTEALISGLTTITNEAGLAALKESINYGKEGVTLSKRLDILTEPNGIAAENNFLMSNAGGIAVKENFIPNSPKDVTIPVDRVVAKMEERTQKEAFSVKDIAGINAKSLDITLGQYTFVNLVQETPVLFNADFATDNCFQLIRVFGDNNPKWSEFSTKNITGESSITYATENLTKENTIRTRIMYEASVSWNGDPAKTFYILADGTVYLDFATLKAKVNIDGLTEESSIVDFANKGIKKYDGGKCYYSVDIKTGEESKVVRNNVYKLKVTSIAKIGTTTPAPDPNPTSINLTVDMKPWTVNNQENIELK